MTELEDILKRVESLADELMGEEKRDAARTELRGVFENSRWYSGRYAAGLTLFTYDSGDEEALDMMNDFVPVWISQLIPKLESITSRTRQVKGKYMPIDKMFCDLVDQNARLDAVRDAGGLYRQSFNPVARSFLRSVYGGEYDYLLLKGIEDVDIHGDPISTGLAARVRVEAGKQLGYSGFRTWFHEDPAEAIASAGLLAAGVALSIYATYAMIFHNDFFRP